MSIKRLAAAAAVATGLGMSVTAVNGGFANSAPLDPPCPSWQKGCSGNPSPNPGYGGTGTPPVATTPHGTPPPQSTWQSTPPAHTTQPPSTQPPPSTWQSTPAPHTTQPPPSTPAHSSPPPASSTWQQPPPNSTTAPMPTECPNWDKNCTPAPGPSPNSGYGGSGTTPPNNTPPSPWQQPAQNGSTSAMPTVCPAWYKNCTPAPNPNPNPNPGYGGSGTTPPNGAPWGGATPTTGAPWGGTTNQPGQNNSYPPRPPRPVLNAPWSQPPHPPYYPPPPPILRPTGEIGGPTNAPGYWVPGQGAPPPPPPSGYGWNNGPAPGAPPPNWEGPPPASGWNGPPPAGGWNQPWQGTPVDASYGQNYYAPFTYNNFTALPVFNADYGGFGYWFFGTWIPLY